MSNRLISSLLLLATATGGATVASSQRNSLEIGAGNDWKGVGGAPDEAGFSQLTEINAGNVNKLGLASSLDLEGEVSLEATPLAVDGILYFSGGYSGVYAVDGLSGKLLWKYDPQVWKVDPKKMGMPVNRGVAFENGRVFIGVIDGRLVALNAKTGVVEWTTQTIPSFSFYNLTGAPRTFNGKVIIGNGGADIGKRGFVTAYDQATGKQAWRFYTVPARPGDNKGDPVMEMAEKTWTGEYWRKGTGGTVWNGMTFDPELNRIYIGVGNAGPYNPAVRNPGGGDNLFVGSIVALDAETGKYIWHYQHNPNESWDYKSTTNMILSDMVIKGKSRKVVLQAPTNGFFYVIDRVTGKLISAEKTGKVTWAEKIDLETGRPVEVADIRYQKGDVTLWPGTLGSHNWQPMSFSPKTGLVYIPYMQMNTRYSTKLTDTDFPYMGVGLSFVKGADPDDGKGALLAWDPVAQKARWRVDRPFLWNGGTLATAGNLVFQGTADGFLVAHDAATGKKLWSFNAGLGIIGSPISWSKAGKQYVSVLVGWGGTGAAGDVLNVGWKYGQQPRRVLTFALGGNKKLPKSPGRDMKVYPVDDPSVVLDEAAIAAGRKLTFMCIACHGRNFESSGAPGPDLRESALAMSEENLWDVVNGGALLERGMPTYKHLTREQVHQLWSVIRASAREAKGTRPRSEDIGGPM